MSEAAHRVDHPCGCADTWYQNPQPQCNTSNEPTYAYFLVMCAAHWKIKLEQLKELMQ